MATVRSSSASVDSGSPSDHRHTDPLLHQQRPLLDHVLLEQVHQEVELVRGPPPVFTGKTVERELIDP
jgi:hypothetical protein